MLKLLLVVALAGVVPAALGSRSIVSSELQATLKGRSVANVFITMKANTRSVLNNAKKARFADRGARINSLRGSLKKHADTTQQPITSFLQKSRAASQTTSFWITNQIYIKNADIALVNSLADKFPDLIESIEQEAIVQIHQPIEVNTNVTLTEECDNQWGIKKIQAPEAWAVLGGRDKAGEGVIVATVDTGVRGTHEALRNNFVGEYGWYDPSSNTSTPTDGNGHGTHTTGTICGDFGIGVAPKAKWMACRGCATSSCYQFDLLACGEFIACPTLTDGTKQDCSKAPNVVSNSWGGGRGNNWFNEVIETWHEAGIITLFSNGNSGPACNTANSPADQNVIGVGSTTIDDEISVFSSVGPTSDGRMKPEIAAPGSLVISAYNTADDAYVSLSGTSMACPHAAGTVALLQTRNKDLTYQEARDLLIGNADQALKFSGLVCDGVEDNVFPNHVFGNGRINALKSVQAQPVPVEMPVNPSYVVYVKR